MKKLNITKEHFEKSRYFTKKYGTLEYVSESGKIYKTSKGKLLKFTKESVNDASAGRGEDEFEIEDGSLVKYNGPGGDVVIPDGITSIGDGAFEDCTNLTSVIIPDGVDAILTCAFQNCTKLKTVKLPDSLESICGGAFCNCTSLKNVILPNGLNEISDWAFAGCRSLTSIRIPRSVTILGETPFCNCDNLEEVVILGNVDFDVDDFPE